MLIDSTIFMYGVFQDCRHGRGMERRLDVLIEAFEIAKQQGRLVVEVPETWVNANELRYSVVVNQEQDSALLPANQQLFSLIYIGTQELKRLCALEAKHALRCLGYAFRNIPALLRTPDQFSPKAYMGCFRIVSNHWDKLSFEMRQAFCDVLGLGLEEATTMANSPGFPSKVWRNLPQD
jgi:hypothetical protein